MGVIWVLDDPLGLLEAPLAIRFLQAGQLKTGDVLSCLDHPHHHLVILAGI